MTNNEFLTLLETVLSAKSGTLKGNEVLQNIDAWDSLATLGFLAQIDEKLNISLSVDRVASAKTVADLALLVGVQLDTGAN